MSSWEFRLSFFQITSCIDYQCNSSRRTETEFEPGLPIDDDSRQPIPIKLKAHQLTCSFTGTKHPYPDLVPC